MKICRNLAQRTDQWFAQRAGRVTASRFASVITPEGKESAQWSNFAVELCCASIRPDELQWEGNFHTDRGVELEPAARNLFASLMKMQVDEVGFVLHDTIPVLGCSPDGLVKPHGGEYVAGLEIKSPLSKHHARNLLDGVCPEQYKPQVHGSMVVTGLRHWYFMSYCEGFPPFITRVDWDDYTDKVKDALERFTIFYAAERKRILPLLTGKKP